MRKSLSIAIFTIIFAAIYMVYTGSYNLLEALIAVVAGAIVAYIFAADLIEDYSKISIKRLGYALFYLLKYFTIIEYNAHMGVLKLILNPKARYSPAIVRVPYDVSNTYSIVFIANSITNTPGTVVIDIDEKRKYYYVHWIDATAIEDKEAKKSVSQEFEDYIKKIFE